MDKIIAKNKEHLKSIIEEHCSKYGWNTDLNFIDTSNVNDMSFLFYMSPFNGNISQWDVSNVTDMNSMFLESFFDGDISQWNTSNVTDMGWMFCESKFNGNISQWNVENVKDMVGMFFASKFNGDISKWNVKNVENMRDMFRKSLLQDCPPVWYNKKNLWNKYIKCLSEMKDYAMDVIEKALKHNEGIITFDDCNPCIIYDGGNHPEL